MRKNTSAPRLGAWMQPFLATAAVALLVGAGKAGLGGVPITHPAALPKWWITAGPLVGTFSVVRLLLIGAGCYWIMLSAAVLAVSCGGVLQQIALERPWRLPGFAWAVRLAVGTSVVSLIAASPVSTATGMAAPSEWPASHSGSVPPAAPLLLPEDAHLPDDSPPSLPSFGSAIPPPLRTRPTPMSTPTPTASGSHWTVRPGDNLWSIAEAVERERLGREPSEPETAELWLRVIRLNRASLADPDNPSLIFPGEVIFIP